MSIQRIDIQNYKAFKEQDYIEIDGKNLVVLGNNGSGKSSIATAIHNLLASSMWDYSQIEQHFSRANEEKNRNIYADENLSPFVQLTTTNQKIYNFSPNQTNTNDPYLKLAYASSDLIDYQFISRLFNYRHTQDNNIFPLFKEEFFEHWVVPSETVTYKGWYEEIQKSLCDLEQLNMQGKVVGRNMKMYKRIEERISVLNEKIESGFNDLIERVHDFLQIYLSDEPIRVKFVFDSLLTTNQANRFLLDDPIVRLIIYHNSIRINRPHAFLNEARLTALGLAIRFAVLDAKPNNEFKLLILDDLLISLDMEMRERIIEAIKGQFQSYQTIILTHNVTFYKFLKNKFASTNEKWLFLEFFENHIDGNWSNPIIKSSLNYLEKSKLLLQNQEYQECAVNLRKQVEYLLKILCDPYLQNVAKFEQLEPLGTALGQIENIYWNNSFSRFRKLATNINFNPEAKGHWERAKLEKEIQWDGQTYGSVNHLHSQVREFFLAYFNDIEKYRSDVSKLKQIAEKLNHYRHTILNEAAHDNEVVIHQRELQGVIDLIQPFEDIIKKISSSNQG